MNTQGCKFDTAPGIAPCGGDSWLNAFVSGPCIFVAPESWNLINNQCFGGAFEKAIVAKLGEMDPYSLVDIVRNFPILKEAVRPLLLRHMSPEELLNGRRHGHRCHPFFMHPFMHPFYRGGF